MFWDGAQEQMDLDDYNDFINSDIMNGDLDSKIYYDIPMTRAASIEDANSSLMVLIGVMYMQNKDMLSWDHTNN